MHPILIAGLWGLWAAFSVDLFAWMKFTGWKLEGFQFAVASKRWVVGFLSGVLGAAGLSMAGG